MGVSERFCLKGDPHLPSEILAVLERDEFITHLGEEIYATTDREFLGRQRDRMAETIQRHAGQWGETPTYLIRAPGRLNAFLEYLDMCAGDHMSATIDGDVPLAVTPRDDGKIHAANVNPQFPEGTLSIRDEVSTFRSAPWSGHATMGIADNWDHRTRVYPYYRRKKGDWLNYLLSPFLRTAFKYPDVDLKGANLTFGPSTIPLRAGTSSSSAIVVLSFIGLYLANKNLFPPMTIREICRMLGEAEWYIGTHGGANDHTTILRNLSNGVLYNRHHLEPLDSTPLPFLSGVRIVLANSLWQANKALGANHTFNLRKGWMDLGNDLLDLMIQNVSTHLASGGETESGWLRRLLAREPGMPVEGSFPMLEDRRDLWATIRDRYRRFGSLDETLLGVPDEAILELIHLLPEEISADEAGRILKKDPSEMDRDYTLPHETEGGYRVRQAASFFYKENRYGRTMERLFMEAADEVSSGRLGPDSPEYRVFQRELGKAMEGVQEAIRDDFQVSNQQLEFLLEVARQGPGYLGGKLTGAGSGGCVCILVEEGEEEAMARWLDEKYYGVSSNFDAYRATLDQLGRNAGQGSGRGEEDPDQARQDAEAAREMRKNLEAALREPWKHRRTVTFSKGAGPIDVDRFLRG